MIRALSTRCWYVNGDWEFGPPHFPTQAKARAAAAEVADEGRPRPVLRRTPAVCWVADCARCRRPLTDIEEVWSELHCTSRTELLAELEAGGWRPTAAGDDWCCPSCTSAHPALADVAHVPVTIRRRDGTTQERVGEATVCPHLAITVQRGQRGDAVWLGVTLTHRPTGRHLPTREWTDDVGELHRVAELVAPLDWGSSDPAHYATGYVEAVMKALEQAGYEQVAAAGGAR